MKASAPASDARAAQMERAGAADQQRCSLSGFSCSLLRVCPVCCLEQGTVTTVACL